MTMLIQADLNNLKTRNGKPQSILARLQERIPIFENALESENVTIERSNAGYQFIHSVKIIVKSAIGNKDRVAAK